MVISNPEDISGLVLWLSADALGYADGATVTSWSDLSTVGNNSTATSGSPIMERTGGPGGGPCVVFPSSDTYFQFGDVMAGATDGEVLAYVRCANTGAQQDEWKWGSSGNLCHYTFSDGNIYEDWGSDTRFGFNPGVDVSQWRRYGVWSATNDWAAQLDASTVATQGSGHSVGWTTTPRVGSNGGGVGAAMRYSTVLVYNRKLTTGERSDLHTWLAANPSGTLGPPTDVRVGSVYVKQSRKLPDPTLRVGALYLRTSRGIVAADVAGGVAGETDTAPSGSVRAGAVITGGTAAETDTALAGETLLGVVFGGVAVETDTAPTGTTHTSITVAGGTAVETDSAPGRGGVLIFGGLAAEVDDAPTGSTTNVSIVGEVSRYGGRRRRAYAVATYTPPVVPPPFAPTTLRRITARAYVSATVDTTGPGVRVTLNGVDRAEAAAHRHRVIVAGRDVTYLRGVETPRPAYQLVSPLLYGPGTLTLPQIAVPFETPGVGSLAWLRKGATVILQRCNADDVVVDTDWVGIITQFGVSGGSLTCTLDGEATGRAGLDYLPPPIFRRRNDLGFWAFSAIRDLRLPFTPHGGPDTGIVAYNWGGQPPLDHISELCAKAYPRGGAPWTLMPRSSDGVYVFTRKNTTTIHATVYFDDQLAVPDLTSDLAEEPNIIYATGVTPGGLRVKNGVYPGLQQGPAPRYPFTDGRTFSAGTTDADTDTGDGVTVMIWKLVAAGYLDSDDRTGNYDGPVTRAIEALQDDAASGLTLVTGNMDPDAWAALYDLDVTGESLAFSHIEPMAQWRKTRKYQRTASGNVRALNPAYDPTILRVALPVDVGPGFTRPQIKEFAGSKLTDESDPNNWVGSVTLNGGAVISGEHNPGDPLDSSDLMQAKRLRPGQNLWAPLWDGGTLFHIATVDVSADDVTTLALDTKARDSMEVWQIIQRNRESRGNPARLWLKDHRKSTMTQDSVVEFDEVGGIINDGVTCAGDAWTVFPVVAGQEGTIARLRMHVSPAREYVVAVFGEKIDDGRLHRLVANPLSDAGTKRWSKANVQTELDQNVLLYSAGTHDAPCGYFPGAKASTGSTTDDDADTDPDPLTGKWQDDAGFAYRTPFGAPVLWVAIYPSGPCTVDPGRIMFNQIEAGT